MFGDQSAKPSCSKRYVELLVGNQSISIGYTCLLLSIRYSRKVVSQFLVSEPIERIDRKQFKMYKRQLTNNVVVSVNVINIMKHSIHYGKTRLLLNGNSYRTTQRKHITEENLGDCPICVFMLNFIGTGGCRVQTESSGQINETYPVTVHERHRTVCRE